jgi:hypothetical protein
MNHRQGQTSPTVVFYQRNIKTTPTLSANFFRMLIFTSVFNPLRVALNNL